MARKTRAPVLGRTGAWLNQRLDRSCKAMRRTMSVEQVVETELDHLEAAVAARERIDNDSVERDDYRAVSVAEPDVVVFGFQRPVVGDRVFDATTEQPAAEVAAIVGAHREAGCQVRDSHTVAADPAAA